MKEELPEVGDLAYVKTWPCCGTFIGRYGKVLEITQAPTDVPNKCSACDKEHPSLLVIFTETGTYPREWTRKVPPLDKPEPSEHNANLSDKIAAVLHKQLPTKV